jgi:hypothetical protein
VAPLPHLFREQLKGAGAIEDLFRHFDAVLTAKGLTCPSSSDRA